MPLSTNSVHRFSPASLPAKQPEAETTHPAGLVSSIGCKPISRHRLAFIAIALGIVMASAAGLSVDLGAWPLLAGLLILTLGVPHGAFDMAIAKRGFHLDRPSDMAMTLGLYVGSAAAVLLLWLIAPQLALPAFLVYSAVHFADDWADELERLPRIVLGVALLTLTALAHPDKVAAIFAWLAPADVASATVTAMRIIGLFAAQAAVVILAVLALRSLAAAAEFGLLAALAILTPPVTFFIVYFCLLHSVRHTIAVHERLQPASPAAFARAAMPYAPLAIFGTVAGALALSTLDPGPALLSGVFIALAALSVPHMLLEHGLIAARWRQG